MSASDPLFPQPGGQAAMTAPRSDDGVLFVPYRETLAP